MTGLYQPVDADVVAKVPGAVRRGSPERPFAPIWPLIRERPAADEPRRRSLDHRRRKAGYR
jgi:hypothetical protein